MFNLRKKTKFPPLHKLCGSDELRPAMQHVLIKDGFAIATDAHCLVKCNMLLTFTDMQNEDQLKEMNNVLIHKTIWERLVSDIQEIKYNKETKELTIIKYINKKGYDVYKETHILLEDGERFKFPTVNIQELGAKHLKNDTDSHVFFNPAILVRALSATTKAKARFQITQINHAILIVPQCDITGEETIILLTPVMEEYKEDSLTIIKNM